MADRICSIDGCDRKVRARGWCSAHHQRWRLGIDMAPPIRTGDTKCSIEHCTARAKARGWCNRHYKLWQRNGDPTKTVIRHIEENFWRRVDKSESCWNWTGRINQAGYGRMWDGTRDVMAHRYSYQLASDLPLPNGQFLDHICHNRRCVNPKHLRPVTQKQNMENHAGPTRRNTSGVRGVSWSVKDQKWEAGVRHGSERRRKLFSDKASAEQWVLKTRIELHTHNDKDRHDAMADIPFEVQDA